MEAPDFAKLITESAEILNEAIADRMVEVLNEAYRLDPECIAQLMDGPIVPCNAELADHSTIQIWDHLDLATLERLADQNPDGESKTAGVRVLGLLNGFTGKYPDGYGRIAASYEVDCPVHGSQDGIVGDICPACIARNPQKDDEDTVEDHELILGKLLGFARVDASKHQVSAQGPDSGNP